MPGPQRYDVVVAKEYLMVTFADAAASLRSGVAISPAAPTLLAVGWIRRRAC